MRPSVLAAGLAAGLATLTLAGTAQAQRVMSLDACADQYLLALAPRETIVGLSYRADRPDSFLRAQAAGLPRRRVTTEAVLGARPDIVVRWWGGDARLVAALARRGVRTVTIDDAADFAGVRVNVRRVAAALNRGPQGEALIGDMDRNLAASAGAHQGRSALYLTPGGFTAGSGTLIDSILKAAGLTNAAPGPYFAPVPLERLAVSPPKAVVLGFFDLARLGADRWGPGRHGALTRATKGRVIAALPGAMVGCPAWFAADATLRLAQAADR